MSNQFELPPSRRLSFEVFREPQNPFSGQGITDYKQGALQKNAKLCNLISTPEITENGEEGEL